MNHLLTLLFALLLTAGLVFRPATATADPLRVYQIGNSWTCLNQGAWDIAQSLGSPNTHGHHIAWNQTLKSLWAGAHDFSTPCRLVPCLTTNAWDIVTLQPWYETWSEATTAATSMAQLAFQANPNTKILIFACGPESSQGPYLTTWNRTDEANYTQPNFWKSKRNYEMIVNQLRTTFPGKQIGIIPMGHCIARVANLLQSGNAVPGVNTVNDLLEQGGQHTSNLGTYIGQLAAYCTFFQQRPHGSTITNLSNCQATRFSIPANVASYMWDLVWDVVSNEPYTLVLPEGADNIGAFAFPNFGTATVSGTNLSITVPYGTNVTALTPTFNVSPGATSVPPSGTTRNFSAPVHYIVTSAGGATTKDFTVTVNIAPYEAPRIGVQRAGGTGGSGTQLTSDQRAGAPGYKQSNWNALGSQASSVSGLKDSSGAVTTAGFTCEAGGSSSNTGNGATPDEILFTGSQYRTWGDWTFNLTGIPYATYDLVFYEMGPGGRTQGTRLVRPTYYLQQTYSPTAAGYVDGSALTPFTYKQATSTSSAVPTVDANYIVFSGLTGASQTVIIPGGFLVTNSFNAFQIVDTSPPPGPQALITKFDFGSLGLATINGMDISLTVPDGTAITALAPAFTLSAGATCDRTSGVATNFTSPVSYAVTSSDTLQTKTYTVTVTVAPPVPQPKDILTFGLPGNAAVISGTNITLTVPYGTAVTALAPTYTISAGASCVPASGSAQNFTAPVHYVVTSAPPALTKDYTVTVVVTPASTAKEILTFGPGATVNAAAGTIAWTVPYGTSVTALAPTFTLSGLASAVPASATARDFTAPQTYTVTAQDGSTKTFTVTVTVAPYVPPASGAIIGVQRGGGLGGGGGQLTAAMRAGAPGFEQANWNALGSFANAASSLKDSTGAVTTAGFTCESGGSAVGNGNAAANSPDEIIFSGGQYRTWGDWTFSITGIPYTSYSLVFYEMGPYARGAQATALTGGPSYYLSQSVGAATAGYVDGNAATPFTYRQVTSTSAASPTVDGNYIVFTGLTGPTQTVTIPGGFQITNTFNAFQIVNTQPAGNTAPRVTGSANVNIGPGVSSATLNLTLTDDGLPADSASTLTATSSDVALLPNSALALTGIGGARTLTITPPPGTNGLVTVSLIASDGELSSTTTFTVTMSSATVAAVCANDAEESAAGSVTLAGESLTAGAGGVVGFRFANLALPQGALITSASVQLTAAASQSGAATFDLTAQASGNAPAFSATARDLQNRATTPVSVLWTPGAFAAGMAYPSPDLTAPIQAVVSRPDWASGNALVILVRGTGLRLLDALEKSGGQPARLTVTYAPAAPVLTLNATVSASANDAEEYADGTVNINSSDLELVYDTATTGNQLVGMRFENITLPPGAKLRTAAIQFATDEVNTEATSLTIRAQAADTAAAFATTAGNLGSRPKTTASAAWAPAAWNTIGERAAAQRTPDLTAVLSEVFSRPGWASGNAVAVFINGTGHRTADSFDDTPVGTQPAQLQLTYTAAPDPGTYQAWSAATLTAAQRAPGANPDGDAFPNLLEFALALNPAAPDNSPVTAQAGPDFLFLSYTRPRSLTGVSITPEWSDAMTAANWSAAGVLSQVISDNGTTQTVRAAIPLPLGGGGRRFARVRVTQP